MKGVIRHRGQTPHVGRKPFFPHPPSIPYESSRHIRTFARQRVKKVDYFEHDADMGIIGRGTTVTQAFESAAKSTFGIMTNLSKVQAERSIQIAFNEADFEIALVIWLNLLLGHARSEGLIFGRFALQKTDNDWLGKAWGEAWRVGLIRGTEVKGATLTMLSVQKTDTLWEARCVVDV